MVASSGRMQAAHGILVCLLAAAACCLGKEPSLDVTLEALRSEAGKIDAAAQEAQRAANAASGDPSQLFKVRARPVWHRRGLGEGDDDLCLDVCGQKCENIDGSSNITLAGCDKCAACRKKNTKSYPSDARINNQLRSDVRFVVPKLTGTNNIIEAETAEAEYAAVRAKGIDPRKAAMKEYMKALKLRAEVRNRKHQVDAELADARRIKKEAVAMEQSAANTMKSRDAAAIRERRDALEDLQEAFKIEQRNKQGSVLIEDLQQKLAKAEAAKKLMKERLKAAAAGQKAALSKLKGKKNAAEQAAQNAQDDEAAIEKKEKEMAKALGISEEEIAAKRAKDEKLLLIEKGKQQLEANKLEVTNATAKVKMSEAVVAAAELKLKNGETKLENAKAAARAAMETIGSDETTPEGLVKAQSAMTTIKRVNTVEAIQDALREELSTAIADTTKRKIHVRFLKKQHETAASAHAEKVKRASKRAEDAAKYAALRAKERAEAKARIDEMKKEAKIKNSLKRMTSQAEKDKEASEKMSMAKKEKKKASEEAAEKSRKAAEEKEEKETEAQFEKQEAEKEKIKMGKKATSAVAKQFEKDFPPGSKLNEEESDDMLSLKAEHQDEIMLLKKKHKGEVQKQMIDDISNKGKKNEDEEDGDDMQDLADSDTMVRSLDASDVTAGKYKLSQLGEISDDELVSQYT